MPPLAADDPLTRLDNVILTPHWSASTTDAWRATTGAMAEGILRTAGYDITAVTDGADALAHLNQRHVDLILSDIALPRLDGLSLAEVVARKGLHTPVIFVTGQPGDELEIKGLELGAVDFIRKPIKKDVLLLRVRKALRAN